MNFDRESPEEGKSEAVGSDSNLTVKRYVVRMGALRQLGLMSGKQKDDYSRGQQVVCRTQRGLESGEVLCRATEHNIAAMENYSTGHIQFAMSDADLRDRKLLEQRRPEALKMCQQCIVGLKLDMELVDIEYLYGGERVVIYYLSEDRVDFRQLVKDLALKLQTRIEMKQIGVRDEAKLLADYGDCGKPVCCNTHLNVMPPVSMKMAKLQKATLDPTKISGRCGRLKCCLRYEYDTYNDIQKTLPPIGAHVLTRDGQHRVLNYEILSEQLLVETEDRRRIMIDASEVLSVVQSKPG